MAQEERCEKRKLTSIRNRTKTEDTKTRPTTAMQYHRPRGVYLVHRRKARNRHISRVQETKIIKIRGDHKSTG